MPLYLWGRMQNWIFKLIPIAIYNRLNKIKSTNIEIRNNAK